MKRLLVGRPLRGDRMGETLLSKRLALPIFASDPLSSVAYATQEILLVLTVGGLAYLFQRGVMVTSVPWQLESSHAEDRQTKVPVGGTR